MKKRVYLFQPNYQAGFGKNFTSHWLPFSLSSVWTYAVQHQDIHNNFELIDVYVVRNEPADIVKELVDPDVCLFSVQVWNENFCLILSKLIKERFPNCIIIYGGNQVDKHCEEYLEQHKFIDSAHYGEGEEILLKMLRDINETGKVKPTYPRSPRLETSVLPSPMYESNVYEIVMKKHPEFVWATTIETNRGCPFKCTFCDWGSMTFSKIKKMHDDRVFNEIEWMAKNKIDFVSVGDANFGVFYERDLAIAKHIVKCKKKYGYPNGIIINWYKNSTKQLLDIAKVLNEGGIFRGFTLSLQSLDNDVLVEIERRNLGINDISEIFHECNVNRISYFTELILGLPKETVASWKTGLDKALTLGLHKSLEIYPLDVLRNSPLADQIDKHGIVTRTVPHIEGGQPTRIPEISRLVVETKYMSKEEMLESWMFSWILVNFHNYGWTQIIARFLHKYKGISYLDLYEDLKQFIQTNPVLNKIYKSHEEAYKAFFWDQVEYKTSNGGEARDDVVLYDNQFELHQNRSGVEAAIAEWASKYFDNVNNALEEDVMLFNKMFSVDYNRPNLEKYNFRYNIYEYIMFEDSLVNMFVEYTFEPLKSWDDFYDFRSKLHFLNRSGFGTNLITNITKKHNHTSIMNIEEYTV
jgi:putative methyltransferase